MAVFRKVHTSFWSDSFISDLDRDKKLFYLYLLTNERTTQCGIYEITKKQMAFDLGYTIDTVSKLLEYFVKCGKIKYNDNTKEIAIKNWCVYNKSTSPLVQSCVNKELKLVKDILLIQYIYSIDTQSQEEEEEEEEEEKEQEEEEAQENAVLTWRDDFQFYLSELRAAYNQLIRDPVWMAEKQKYYPGLNIQLSLEKACVEFWATEAGWKNKKASRTKIIDWKATLTNALSLKSNKVYESKPAANNNRKELENLRELSERVLQGFTGSGNSGNT